MHYIPWNEDYGREAATLAYSLSNIFNFTRWQPRGKSRKHRNDSCLDIISFVDYFLLVYYYSDSYILHEVFPSDLSGNTTPRFAEFPLKRDSI